MNTSTERFSARQPPSTEVPWAAAEAAIQFSPWRDFLARFVANRSATVGLSIILLLCLVALLAPVLALHPYAEQDLLSSLDPPLTPGHPLGADNFGRDVYSRIVWGARVSLQVGLIVTSVSMAIGILIGCVSGYYGGRIDLLLSNLFNLVWGFPLILVALLLVTVVGPGLNSAMIATGLVIWSGFARIVRGEVLALRDELWMAVLLITHALGVVAEMADRVAVMYAGHVVEYAPVEAIFGNPRHPYTIGLLQSIPDIELTRDRLYAIPGTVPSLLHPLPGCYFWPRCPLADQGCRESQPPLSQVGTDHEAACWKAQ